MRRRSLEEAQRWITHAKDEFKDADDLRERERFYLALFHFQQATEKALKAFLYLKVESTAIFITHSITELVEMAKESDTEFEKVIKAKKLDRFYIPTRYPNGLPGGIPSRYFDDPEEAKEAMELAKAVLDLVEKKIKEGNS
ncbi:MAG: HEPN domain-containing protein [Promethearchaeota archaeon]